MKSKVKKQIKKFIHLSRNKGIFTAGIITGAKVFYHLTKKKEIEHLRQNRPSVVKNRLVFYSSIDYSDNARALSDYLVEQGYLNDHEIIWLVSDPDKFKKYERQNLKFVREKYKYSGLRTPEAFEYIWTADKIFFTHSMRWIKDSDRRKDQTFINLWHGCGYKAAKGKSENIHFDYVLVPGGVFVDTKSDFFQCGREKVLPLGYPRYDLMLANTEGGKNYVNKFRFCNGAENAVVLWMPTYRMSENMALCEDTITGNLGLPVIDGEKDLYELNQVCEKEHVVLVLKRHHLQSCYSMKEDLSNIKYIDDLKLQESEVQLYEILPWVDALITDYSSVAIDFMLLNKPMGFTLDDYERYKQSRGFVFEDPLSYMPGMHIFHKQDFFEFIKIAGRKEDFWEKQRGQIIPKTHNLPKEGYCKGIADYFHI